jgi:hypothetical protein
MQKQIMRRVYYSYLISLVSHSMMWQGVFLGAAAVLLARWLHVASIINNLLAVQVGAVPEYMLGSVTNAATSGELHTVIMLVAAAGVAVSAGFKLAEVVFGKRVTMSRSL